MERRTPLVELSEEHAREALATVRPRGELSSFQLIAGGRANTSYLLDTDQGRLVLRLHVRDPDAGPRERALQSRFGTLIPTAPVVGGGTLPAGHAFSLLGFVEGDSLEHLLSSGQERGAAAAARRLGQALARLSHQRFSQPGELVLRANGALEVEPFPFDDYFRSVLFESPAAARLGDTRDRLWQFLERAPERYPDDWHPHRFTAISIPVTCFSARRAS